MWPKPWDLGFQCKGSKLALGSHPAPGAASAVSCLCSRYSERFTEKTAHSLGQRWAPKVPRSRN